VDTPSLVGQPSNGINLRPLTYGRRAVNYEEYVVVRGIVCFEVKKFSKVRICWPIKHSIIRRYTKLANAC